MHRTAFRLTAALLILYSLLHLRALQFNQSADGTNLGEVVVHVGSKWKLVRPQTTGTLSIVSLGVGEVQSAPVTESVITDQATARTQAEAVVSIAASVDNETLPTALVSRSWTPRPQSPTSQAPPSTTDPLGSIVTSYHSPTAERMSALTSGVENEPELPPSTATPLPTIHQPWRFVTGYFGIGRLGNNLFVYASTLGVALRHGFRVVYCLGDSQLARYRWVGSVFQLSAPAGACNFDADAYIFELGWGKYTPAVESPRSFGRRTYLLTYLQSYKYFEAYRPQVLRELALTQAYGSYADDVLRQAAASRRNVTFVGVHVRRGDMVGHRLYNVAPESYLVRAVGLIRQRLGSATPVAFVVASDDTTWTAAMLRRIGLFNDATLTNASAELDMAVLSRCNHSIITSGSYGWWAAWLAGGDVIYYRGFMPNTSELAKDYDPADYYPFSWIGLD